MFELKQYTSEEIRDIIEYNNSLLQLECDMEEGLTLANQELREELTLRNKNKGERMEKYYFLYSEDTHFLHNLGVLYTYRMDEDNYNEDSFYIETIWEQSNLVVLVVTDKSFLNITMMSMNKSFKGNTELLEGPKVKDVNWKNWTFRKEF